MGKQYSFEIEGDIPSKKNSYRVNLLPSIITFIRNNLSSISLKTLSKYARVRPSKQYDEWEKQTVLKLIRKIKRNLYLGKVEIWFRVYFPRKGQAGGDIDNKITSILDVLQKAGIIQNDSYNCVTSLHAKGIYRKGQGGAEFIIEDLTED